MTGEGWNFLMHDLTKDRFDFESVRGIKSMTGEGWNFLMHDLTKDRFDFESVRGIKCMTTMNITKDNFAWWEERLDPGKVDGFLDNPIECPGGVWPYIFFTSYTIIVTSMFLNLFIAV